MYLFEGPLLVLEDVANLVRMLLDVLMEEMRDSPIVPLALSRAQEDLEVADS